MNREIDEHEDGNWFSGTPLAAAATSVGVAPAIIAISASFFVGFPWSEPWGVLAGLGFNAFVAVVSALSARFLGPVRPILYGCLTTVGSAALWSVAGWISAILLFDSTNLGIAAIPLGIFFKWAATAGGIACLYTGIVSTLTSWWQR